MYWYLFIQNTFQTKICFEELNLNLSMVENSVCVGRNCLLNGIQTKSDPISEFIKLAF